MAIFPLHDWVVVLKDEAVTKTVSGLYVPQTVEDKISTGTVVAVGSGRVCSNGTVLPLEVKVGDKVAFSKSFATELKIDGETSHLLKEEQVLCVLK